MFCEGELVKFKKEVSTNNRYGIVIEFFKIMGQTYYHIYSGGSMVVANETIVEKIIP